MQSAECRMRSENCKMRTSSFKIMKSEGVAGVGHSENEEREIWRVILHAVDSDRNPKRKRGAKLLSSLTLRVTMSCVIFDRV
jgi:hypothetical protein